MQGTAGEVVQGHWDHKSSEGHAAAGTRGRGSRGRMGQQDSKLGGEVGEQCEATVKEHHQSVGAILSASRAGVCLRPVASGLLIRVAWRGGGGGSKGLCTKMRNLSPLQDSTCPLRHFLMDPGGGGGTPLYNFQIQAQG